MRVEDNVKDVNDLDFNINDMAVNTEYNFHSLDVPFVDTGEIFPIGLDVGFSAVKTYSMHGHHKFPSLITPVSEEELAKVLFRNNSTIAYRDKNITNKIWLIGEIVSESTGSRIAEDEDKLYTDQRVGSKENIILNRMGIALSLMNKKGIIKKNAEIRMAVGLPDRSSDLIKKYKEQLSGYHEFEIQLGRSEKWIPISFVIKKENIDVLSQPFGTLLSIALNRQGKVIDKELLEQKRSLIFDGGFGTIDTFVLQSGRVGKCLTWKTRAMKSIYEKLIKICLDQIDRKIGLHQINRFLSLPKEERSIKSGVVTWHFDADLNNLIKDMAKENITELLTSYDTFNDIDILIMTGGTSKVLYPYFVVGITNLEIKIAELKDAENPEENFNCVYANAVGFFNYVLMKYRLEINYKEPANELTISEAAITRKNNK